MGQEGDRFASLIPGLKPESLGCLQRLEAYKPPKHSRPFPLTRSASVAIVLFVGRKGDIHVLLSTRAGDMRTYAGDSALPGGKYEPGDEGPEGTARREAWEEIGLPMDNDKVLHLTNLDVFLAGNNLIVTPGPTRGRQHDQSDPQPFRSNLNLFNAPRSLSPPESTSNPGWEDKSSRVVPLPPEVAAKIYPAPKPPYSDSINDFIGGNDAAFYQYRDITWGQGRVRMHRFLTGREASGVKPVFGLTAGILVQAASIAYDQVPAFDLYAPDQPPMMERIEWTMRKEGNPLRQAAEEEGILDAWRPVPRSKL